MTSHGPQGTQGASPSSPQPNGGARTPGRFSLGNLNPMNLLRRRPAASGSPPPSEGAAPRGVAGMLQNLASGNIPAAFSKTAADEIDAGRGVSPSPTAPPESSGNTLDKVDFTKIANEYKGDPAVKKYLQGFAKELEKKGKKPNKVQQKNIEKLIIAIETASKEKGGLPFDKDIFLKKGVSEIMKETDSTVKLEDIMDRTLERIEGREKKGEKIFEDISSCFTDKDGAAIKNDKNHIVIDKDKVEELRKGMSDDEKRKYKELLASADVPDDLKNLSDDSKELHLRLIAQVKTGKKMKAEMLKKLVGQQKDGTLSKLPLKKFVESFKDIIGSESANKTRRKLEEAKNKFTPKENEKEALKEQIVGDKKGQISQEKWDKMTPEQKDEALLKQKQMNDFIEKLPPEQQEKFKALDPDSQKKAYEDMMGAPLGSPQSMMQQNDPEMMKKMLHAQQKAMNAMQENAEMADNNAREMAKKQYESAAKSNEAAAKMVGDMAGSVGKIASGISGLRNQLLQQALDRADQSMKRQQQMMDKMSGSNSSSSGGYS